MTSMAITQTTPMLRPWLGLLAMFVVSLASSCDRPAPPNQDPLQIGSKTLEFNLNQRMTQTVPGVMGRISLKLGDIESAKGVEDIEVIDHKDESSVAVARDLRRGEVLHFEIDDTPYVLQLVDYDATHIISDNATFALRLGR